MPWRAIRVLLISLGVVVAVELVSAHDLSQSTSTLAIEGKAATVRLSIDLLAFDGVDRNADTRVSYEELDRAIDRVFAAIKAHYLVVDPEPPVSVVAERYEIADEHVLHIDVRYTFDQAIRRLDVTSTLHELARPDHEHLITATIDGRPVRDRLTAGHQTASFLVSGFSMGRLAAAAGAVLGLLALVLVRLRTRTA